jgi:hypothetical protein
LVPVTGTVIEEGTAINKAYLQPIEDALEEFNSHKAEKATDEDLGHVKVDGETITASNGVISAQTQIVDAATNEKWEWGMENGVVFLEKVVS